ncbi:hypothetical protein MJO28_005981 [Puccinia striiformis f. sp. tritici]|uniref:NADP-dependent oxidoreductase domain-containing protein n=3 Tax=Puccinia striiformis TaxID=27350 RepID=A0A0L0V716_9BASI|nr:hypothetical protein Pst134EA_011210 [Puccinia striiformis f. sp. tritici]KAI9604824.1 hypothetical protein H4Q26_002794 [Puccinia striiformis f. sp. tritici PST-130]KNE94799.1 hypothetical protein PSTG_11891 [Puccinia striiformis f. sp. tritici PST-78]POW05087.1 hypothetical protein PSTT_09951 [Puccinia striiformis]KAH9455965.1 hypothetical protein Pst134EB_012192 [Puccinia striiformis f. sp. tritici]KAH9467571.1 hypothetical protein Pst134EA_011210 [Puccinia striiformis f. sp. tritici]
MSLSASALSTVPAIHTSIAFPTPLTMESRVTLNTGHQMPILGFGTWSSANAQEACEEAIKVGYRHLDSARIYGTEAAVGVAVGKCEPNRNSIFLTTKIRGLDHGTEKCKKALSESYVAPRPDYWDLILLHDPLAGTTARHEAYEVLAQAQKDGKVKSIGVSNFGVDHLESLAGQGFVPAVNQLELHPWCQQKSIVDYCQSNGIMVQAYCPLARGRFMSDETLVGIAKEVEKTVGQVLLRWSLQKGFVPLPKSDKPHRIRENADIFDFQLSDEHMSKLDGLNQGKDIYVSWTAQFAGVQ